MGITQSEILQRSITEDERKLYWTIPPYEGPIKLRFSCSTCGNETIVLEPYPKLWKDITNLKGLCYTCVDSRGNPQTRKAFTLFLEAARPRVSLYRYEGGNSRDLVIQLEKFLTSGPLRHDTPDESFCKKVHPHNIRNTILAPNFRWPEGILTADLMERRRTMIQSYKSHFRAEGTWIIQIPSRDEMLPYSCKAFLQATPETLRKELAVRFSGEPAIDLGGVTREFFSEVSKKLLDPSLGLFVPIGPNQTYHPSASSGANDNHLNYFRFFGRLVGKALFEGELITANFTRAVFKMMLGKSVTFNDFQTVDKDLHLQFRNLMNYDQKAIEDLCLCFTAKSDELQGTIDLIPNGANIPLTKQNLTQYIQLYTSWRMVDSVERQLMNLLEGFFDIIPVQFLSIFNESELELLLCGVPEINVQEWQAKTLMLNFPPDHQCINWFWEVLKEFSTEQRAMVFHFATGTGRIISFDHLYPQFSVYCLGPNCDTALPFAHTCFNRLDLPLYSTKQILMERLRTAINYGSHGFGLE